MLMSSVKSESTKSKIIMDRNIEIAGKCVSLCKVPDLLSRNDVISRVNGSLTLLNSLHEQIQIVDIELIPGAEEQKGLCRWILLLRSVEGAKAFLANLKYEEIMIGNENFTAEYQSSIACEIPERWKTNIPKVDEQTPLLARNVLQGVQQPAGFVNQWVGASGYYQNYPPIGPLIGPPGQGQYVQYPELHQGVEHLPEHKPDQFSQMRPVQGYSPSFRYPFVPNVQIQQAPVNFGNPSNIAPGLSVYPATAEFSMKLNKEREPRDRNMSGNFQYPLRLDEKTQCYRPFDLNTGQFIPVPAYSGPPQSQTQLQPQLSPRYNEEAHELPPRYIESVDLDERPSSTHGQATVQSKTHEPDVFEPCTYIGEIPNKILVSNIPPAAMDDQDNDYLKMFFEKKELGSFSVADLHINKVNQTAIVQFTDPRAVETILQKPNIQMKGSVINIQACPSQPEAIVQSQNCTEDKTQLIISNIPRQCLNEEMIRLTFEHRRYGGVEVKSVEIDEEHAAAIVEFFSTEAVEQILQKRPIMIAKLEVDVDWYIPNEDTPENEHEETDDVEKATQILLSNLPLNINDEYLQMFFERKQFGDCTVVSVDMLEDSMAIVTFGEQDAVKKILKFIPIQMNSKTVEVKAYIPPPVMLCTIEVRGPPAVVNHDQLHFLEMYFENTRRSGGEEVNKSSFDSKEQVVYITFLTEEVAKRVVDKGDHQINKQKIDVKLHIPERKLASKERGNSQTTGQNKDEEPQQPIRTVKVKGYVKSKSRNTLQLYFENTRRSGGGGEVTIDSDEEDNNVLYVHFEEESVAERVADSSRLHTVEGCKLNVSLHIPPKPKPCYEDRLLLKGMKPTTTRDGLFNFLEAKTGCIPVGLTYHAEDEDTVIVTFQEIVDFEKTEEAIRKYKLEGATLKVSRVPISNCIIVSNLAPDVTKDTVEYYFENARKSGGGLVDKVVMLDSERSCLVYFNDYQVIDNVLHQEHKLSEKKLEVFRYLESLGVRDGEGRERKFQIPETIIISDIEPHKVRFLKTSPNNMDALETQLKPCHAKVQLPSNENDNISIICTLTKDVANSFKLAKEWHANAEGNFKAFMKNIIIHQTGILQDIWEKVMEKLKTINIPNPEAVALFVDKKDGQVTVVGMKHVVGDLAMQISDKIKQVTDQAEKERQKVKELVSTLKPIETSMFLADKFPTKMQEKFPDLKVHITQKNEIMFEGVCTEVKEAKLAMYEIKGKFGENYSKISAITEELYLTNQTKEYIAEKLRQRNVTAVWETNGQSLHICSSSRESLKDCVEIVRGSVIENAINITPEAHSILNSEKWIEKVKEWHLKYLGKCKIYYQELSREIHVCATDDISRVLFDDIDTYLTLNTIYESKISFERSIHRLIEKYHKDSICDIAKRLQNNFVQISYGSTYSNFEIKGTNEGISEATKELQKLVKQVQKKEYKMKHPGLGGYIQSIKGKDSINTVESYFQCMVEVKGQAFTKVEPANTHGTIPVDRKTGVRIKAHCKTYNNVTIFSAEGDMTELSVDLLVNSADEVLSLQGGLGSVMVSKGGQSIKKACEEHIKKHTFMAVGDAFMCSAGNLKAKHILHVVGPAFKGGKDGENKMLEEAVITSMKQASDQNLASIAIPAISCGVFGYPVKQATAIIVKAVLKFFDKEKDSSLKEMYLCDIKEHTVKCFTNALIQQLGTANVTKLPTEDDKMEDDRPKQVPHPKNDLPSSMTGNDNMTKIGNITVSVIIGEIAQQKVDVIANTAALNLDLTKGAVSASLLGAAGQQIQDEITQNYPNGLQGDQVAITSGCKLDCKIVVHGALPNWKEDDASVKALHGLMHSCLGEVHRRKYTSVAFPALGTGNLNFPRNVVAKEMFTAVSKFSKDYPQSSVNDIRFCLYHKDIQTIQAFMAEEGNWKTERNKSRSDRKIESMYHKSSKKYNDQDSGSDNIYEEIPRNESIKSNNINIIVKQGDITKEDTDCIVNSSNENLDLSRGAVSQAILKKGGTEFEKKLLKKKSQMKKESLVVTSAPGLQCQKIIHVVAQDNIKDWMVIIDLCLKNADKKQMASIAFPALGTAGGYANPDEIASAMVKAVMQFGKSKPVNLKEVRFVIYQPQMVQSFDNAIKNVKCETKVGIVGTIYNTVKGYIQGRSQNESSNAISKQTKGMLTPINEDEVTFIIWSMKTDILDQAFTRLQALLQRDTLDKEFKDSIIKRLQDFEVLEIEAIAKQHHVRVDVDTHTGVITASGITTNVMNLSDKIYGLIKDASTREQNKNAADLMSNVIEWSFIEVTQTGNNLQLYDKELSYKIEMAFQNKLPCIEFTTNQGDTYKVDFSKMIEYPLDNPSDSVQVIRRDRMKDSSFELPGAWAPMTGNLRVVSLQATDQEYKDIVTKFKPSSGLNKIVKIERIQNKALWQQYQAKKKQLESQNHSSANFTNEKLLWHGTAGETVDSINAHGFNRSYCGKNAVVYGEGVYFAVDATYSCSNTYSRPDPQGVKHVYCCRVLTGEFTKGLQGMRVPPNKPGAGSHALYDSVVDNVQTPSMYIIFHDTQAYPEYLVSFN